MTPKLLLRIAAGAVLFFALGHTMGHLTRKSTNVPEAKAVFKIMEEYKFPIGSQLRSYDEFYEGMSINLIITLLSITAILWMLSSVSSQFSKITSQLLWPVLLCLVAFTFTGFMYFFILPAATCALASLLIVFSIIKLNKASN
jgi:hypothetical protein